jgi:hypothetical protein
MLPTAAPTKEDVVAGYNKIQDAYGKNVRATDIYKMIQDWINAKPELAFPSLTLTVRGFAKHKESIQDIVEEFVYGQKYASLRALLERS